MKLLKYIPVFIVIFLMSAERAQALVSPDIIIIMSAALATIISTFSFVGIIILSLFKKVRVFLLKHYIIFFVLFLVLIAVLVVGPFLFSKVKKNIEYNGLLDSHGLDSSQKGLAGKISSFSFDEFPKDEYVFIDVREDREVKEGFVKNLQHIRLADILVEEKNSFDQNKKYVFFCLTGERGKIAADYFSSRGFESFYLEEGLVSHQNDNPEDVIGDLPETVSIQGDGVKLYSYEEILQLAIRNNLNVLDYRKKSPEKFSIFSLSSNEIEENLKTFSNTSVLILCDDSISCFDVWISIPVLRKFNVYPVGYSYHPYE